MFAKNLTLSQAKGMLFYASIWQKPQRLTSVTRDRLIAFFA